MTQTCRVALLGQNKERVSDFMEYSHSMGPLLLVVPYGAVAYYWGLYRASGEDECFVVRVIDGGPALAGDLVSGSFPELTET